MLSPRERAIDLLLVSLSGCCFSLALGNMWAESEFMSTHRLVHLPGWSSPEIEMTFSGSPDFCAPALPFDVVSTIFFLWFYLSRKTISTSNWSDVACDVTPAASDMPPWLPCGDVGPPSFFILCEVGDSDGLSKCDEAYTFLVEECCYFSSWFGLTRS